MVIAAPVLARIGRDGSKFHLTLKTLRWGNWDRLLNYSFDEYKVIQYIREFTPSDSTFLVFRQADFVYYAQRKFIRHLDPTLIKFYGIKEKKEAYEYLRNIGIDYIYSPHYQMPSYYNSMVKDIVNDPNYCQLVCQGTSSNLFKLAETVRRVPEKCAYYQTFKEPIENGSNEDDWYVISSKDGVLNTKESVKIDKSNLTIKTNNRFETTYVVSVRGPLDLPPRNSFAGFTLKPNTVYRLETSLKGNAIIKLFIIFYKERFNDYEQYTVWNSVLASSERYATIGNQFLTPPDVKGFRVLLRIPGKSMMSIKYLKINEILTDEFIADIPEATVKKIRRIPVWSTFPAKQELPARVMRENTSHDGVLLGDAHKSTWIFSGKGKKSLPPSYWYDKTHILSESWPQKIDLNFALKGKGVVELFILWFNKSGSVRSHYINKYFLPTDYKSIHERIWPPEKDPDAIGYLDEDSIQKFLYYFRPQEF